MMLATLSPPIAAYWPVLVLMTLAALAAAVLAWRFLTLLRRRLRELHLQDENLSRRLDRLNTELEWARSEDRMDHLEDLVNSGEVSGRLSVEVAGQLRAYLRDLRQEL